MSPRSRSPVFLALSFATILLKLGAASLGHNFDLESWIISADTILAGDTLYADTVRHNYGPIWAYVFAGLRAFQINVLGESTFETFHLLLTSLLALVDIALAFLVWRAWNFNAGLILLLNPISLLISGYHAQLDNSGVLAGLVAVLVLNSEKLPRDKRVWFGALLLGLSLVVKHILMFFPLWFAFRREYTIRQRAILVVLPGVMFALGFLPFILRDARAFDGVVLNVITYSSVHMTGFSPELVNLFFPVKFFDKALTPIPVLGGFKLLWMPALIALGYFFRDRKVTESFLFYLVGLMVLSSAMVEQYYAIPLAACAVYWNRRSIRWYLFVATLFLCASPANIGSLPALEWLATPVRGIALQAWHPIVGLFIFLAWELYHSRRILREQTIHPSSSSP